MTTISSEQNDDYQTKFTISGKEYSLASVIGPKLNNDPEVMMAGSRVINDLEIIVRTREKNRASQCLVKAFQDLEQTVDEMLSVISE